MQTQTVDAYVHIRMQGKDSSSDVHKHAQYNLSASEDVSSRTPFQLYSSDSDLMVSRMFSGLSCVLKQNLSHVTPEYPKVFHIHY